MTRQIKLCIFVFLLAACGEQERSATTEPQDNSGDSPLLVVASNYPVYFFASRLVEGIPGAPEIVLPDIEGDLALWVPDAEQVQLLQSADRVLLNGAGAESWLDLVSIDKRILVDTTANVREQLIPLAGAVQHQHGPEGEHSHQGYAFTTWLDPRLAAIQAAAIANTLAELAPSADAGLRSNLARLNDELNALDGELTSAFAGLGDQPVLFSHPVYQYLERRFGINGESLHWEPDIEPSTPDWVELQQLLARHPAKIMFWEAEPLPATRARLESMGIVVHVFATAAGGPGDGDYFDTMRTNLLNMRSAIAAP